VEENGSSNFDVTGTGSPIYSKHFEVPADAIDQQGHVSNLAYVTWMQDVARPAFAGDRLGLHTWVPRFDQRSTPRRYLFVREPDHRVVADAETRWVFVDLTSGRRRPLPPDLLDAFEPVPDEPTVRRVLGVSG